MVFYLIVGVGIFACALFTIFSRRLLISAIWLALTSALVAVLIYMLGAPHIAVIELSVGAGLVTILFVFAINIAGEDITRLKTLIPQPVAIFAIVLALALGLVVLLRDPSAAQEVMITPGKSAILWEVRYVDILLQVVLIFSGVLGVIGLLADKTAPVSKEKSE